LPEENFWTLNNTETKARFGRLLGPAALKRSGTTLVEKGEEMDKRMRKEKRKSKKEQKMRK